MVALARQLLSEYDNFIIGFSGVSGWSVILYAAAALLILTQPVDRYTFPIIITVAVVCRLIPLFPDPYLSSDAYRYVWDGIVQHAHISPFRYVPGDPALAFLRAPNQDVFDSINRRDYAHTIYPPAAQFLFYVITFMSPTVVFMKTAMVLFEGLTMYGLVTFLRELGIRREQSLLYAWCPLLIWEIAGSGHLDSAAMALMTLALLARYRRQAVATGVFLAIAVLIKLYPLVLLPALFRRGEYRMPATFAAVIAFGYACYSSVGMRVFGFLGGYVKEEGIDTGTRYFLLEFAQHLPGLHRLPPIIFLVFCALVFAGLMLWCWNTCCKTGSMDVPRGTFVSASANVPRGTFKPSSADVPRGTLPVGQLVKGDSASSVKADFLPQAFALAAALMLLFSPHYPWYVAWLVPFLVLLPNLTAFTYICGLFYLCTTAMAVGSGPQQYLLNKYLYGSALLAFLVEVTLRRWPLRYSVLARVKLNSSPALQRQS